MNRIVLCAFYVLASTFASGSEACQTTPRHEPLVRNELTQGEVYARSLAELISTDSFNQTILLLVPDKQHLTAILPELKEGVTEALARCDNELEWTVVGKREFGNKQAQIVIFVRGIPVITLQGLIYADTSDRIVDGLARSLEQDNEIRQKLLNSGDISKN